MGYTGSGKYTYWATLTKGVTTDPGMVSEEIPVIVDGTTKYSFSFAGAFQYNSYTVNLELTFYDATDSVVSTVTANGTVGTSITSITTTPTTAPATSTYAELTIYHDVDGFLDTLQVYYAGLETSENTAVPSIVNTNYSFIYSTDPWTADNDAILSWMNDPLTSSDGDEDSLVLGDMIELMGGAPGVQSMIPELIDDASGNGAIFRILAPGGTVSAASGQVGPYDLGAPQPTTDVIESLLLDGERPFGSRSSNRTISIPVMIFAPTLRTLAAAREMLLSTIDQQTWKMTWRPASSGLPQDYDCFRASPSVVTYGFNYNREGENTSSNPAAWALSVVTISFQALPFAKSGLDGTQVLAFADGVLDAGAIKPEVVFDDFTSVVPGTATPANDFNHITSPGGSITTANSGSSVYPANTAFDAVTLTSTGTATYDNSEQSTASMGAKVASGASGGTVSLEYSGTNPDELYTQWFRMYVFMQSLPASTVEILSASDASATVVTQVKLTSTGHIEMGPGGAATITSSAALNTNEWFRIEGYVKADGSTGQVSFSVYNGDAATANETQTSSANLNTGANQITDWKTGILNSGVTSFTYWLDNLALGAAGKMGEYDTTRGNWKINTAYAITDSQSARYSAGTPQPYPYNSADYLRRGLLVDITGLKTMAVWVGMSYDTQWPVDKRFKPKVAVRWTLTDVNGKYISFSETQPYLPWGADPNKPVWTRVGVAIPQGKKITEFDYSKVVSYKVQFFNWHGAGTAGLVRMHAWLCDVRAIDGTAKWLDTPHGSVYSVFGLPGMARSPMTAEVQLPAENDYVREITQSGYFTVPVGVTNLSLAETWGGGGGGGSVSGQTKGRYAPGGGGGEYAAESDVAVIPGTKIPVTIGAGGSGGEVVFREDVFAHHGTASWTCPDGVDVINVYLWGAGAAGTAGGGGGGGGAYTEGTVNVTPGVTYRYTIGKGGSPNWGTLSKDQATRDGGDTVVRGDTGAVHAAGGYSPVTGGSQGGKGAAAFGPAETGTTVTLAVPGGAGGNSPGAAGGGGGGSGSNLGAGKRGGDSPKGANNYGTGGTGATIITGSNGGAGGKGADVNGVPSSGQTPGGGGGGGYTKGANNNGAGGGQGKIVIKYQQNVGAAIDGSSTVFGKTGLTDKIVTAHGGSTPANNATDGAAGGTGSTNTTHYDGGKGGMSSNHSDYLFSVNGSAGSGFSLLKGGSAATATSYQSGTSSAALNTGIAIVTVVSGNALDSAVSIYDDAGNTYRLVNDDTQLGSAGTGKHVSVYSADIGAPITTSHTLHLDNNGVSDSYVVTWYGSAMYRNADTDNTVSDSGTSTTPSAVLRNPDLSTHRVMFNVLVNDSSASVTALPTNHSYITADGVTSSKYTSGTTNITTIGRHVGANSLYVYKYATYGSSVDWGSVSVPLVPQDTYSPVPILIGKASSSGTSVTFNFTSGGMPLDTGNSGMLLLVMHAAGGAGTTSVTDTPGNTWNVMDNFSVNGSGMRVYTATMTTGFTSSDSITYHDTNSQQHEIVIFWIPNGALDSSATGNNTGTGTTASETLADGAHDNLLDLVLFVNNSTMTVSSGPSGYVNAGHFSNGTQAFDVYMKRRHGLTGASVSATYGSSTTWGVMEVPVATIVHSSAGGASGGPLGAGNDGTDTGGPAYSGGGKGADGLINTIGTGNDAAVPGGGGGGAGSTDTTDYDGGSGASGMVRLTWTPPLRTFNDLILHRPGENSKQTLCPVVSIPPNDPPDNREYSVPSLISGRNAEFWGTYSVLLVANDWNSATTGSSRRVSVTVNQYEYAHGPAISVQATRIITPATDVVNGYVDMGPLTLPIKDYDESNDNVYYTVSIHDTDSGDSFQDILFLDVTGETVLVNIAPGTAGDSRYSSYYIDEPTADKALGQILGSNHGRTEAVSVLDMAAPTGGPLYLDSGHNLLLVYSSEGAPNLAVRYLPRWFTDRIQ